MLREHQARELAKRESSHILSLEKAAIRGYSESLLKCSKQGSKMPKIVYVTPRTQYPGRIRDGRTLLRASPKEYARPN